MGKGPEQTFLQRGHTDGKQTYEKMLNVTNHQRILKKVKIEIPFDPIILLLRIYPKKPTH